MRKMLGLGDGSSDEDDTIHVYDDVNVRDYEPGEFSESNNSDISDCEVVHSFRSFFRYARNQDVQQR